jgi:hypothetical protein
MSCQGPRIKAAMDITLLRAFGDESASRSAAQPPVVDDQCQVEDASHAKQGTVHPSQLGTTNTLTRAETSPTPFTSLR